MTKTQLITSETVLNGSDSVNVARHISEIRVGEEADVSAHSTCWYATNTEGTKTFY